MPLTREEIGEVFAMASELQAEYNALTEKQDKIAVIIKRLKRLSKPELIDEDGDKFSDVQLKSKYAKAKQEFEKCLPKIKKPKIKPE